METRHFFSDGASETTSIPHLWLMWDSTSAMWGRLWHNQHTLGHFQSILHIQELIAVEGKHAFSRQRVEKARKLYNLSIYDKPTVTQGALGLSQAN